MEDSQKLSNPQWIMLGLVLGLFVGAAIFSLIVEEEVVYKDKIIYQEKEQPMLLVYYNTGGPNINDNSEMIFVYDVANFGNVKAKNVSIICQVQDIKENIIKEQIFNIGNIASNSYEYQESYMDYTGPEDQFAVCKLNDADGDYINLYDRLSDLN